MKRCASTTGWLRATSGGRVLADQRIETDAELFWDHFQAKTLPAIYDYEMAVSKGKPRPEDAPFFGELRVDLTLSEPSYKLDIDNELIAPLESVQEEIYFNTLHFFDVLGRQARGQSLDYIGRVIPVVHPKSGRHGGTRPDHLHRVRDGPSRGRGHLPRTGRRHGGGSPGHPQEWSSRLPRRWRQSYGMDRTVSNDSTCG